MAQLIPSCKRVKLPGTGIGQAAFEDRLLPALLASSTLIDVQLPGCGLTHVPAELFTIQNVTSINLSHNQLRGGVPSTLWQATSLRRLELQAGEGPECSTPSTPSPAFPGAEQEHDLGEFPPAFPAGMTVAPRHALRHLNIAGCGVRALHPSIAAFRDLQVLMAGRNPMKELPGELAQCGSLAVLDVLGCPLTTVPAALSGRRGLELKTGLPDVILPWLYLGDATAAANLPGLQARGISRVLSLVQPAECLLHAGMDCLNVAVDDTPIARLGFATCPVPYFLRFALCPVDEVPTPSALGLSHGSVGGVDALVEADIPEAPQWIPPHLAPHAGVSFGERGLPPLHLHAHRRDTRGAAPAAVASAEQPPPLLVHCHAGASRSATATVVILMALLQWPLVRAFKHVKTRRGVVQPNIGFCDQLLHFERTLLQVGILDCTAPEFAPPPSIGAAATDSWPNSISMKQLVQQSAGSMSASVWNARYSKPAAAPKRRVDPGLKLRALVKTVAAACRFAGLHSKRLVAAASPPSSVAPMTDTPPAAAPSSATGFHANNQHDPRTLSATHAGTVAATPAVAAGARAAGSTHRSWSVSTKWLTDKDAERQGAVSPAAAAEGSQVLPPISDGDESSYSKSSSPRRRPAGLAKRPSIDLADWEESKASDSSAQVNAQEAHSWGSEDQEAAQASRNRMRYAPNATRSAPPCLSALPNWAWRRLADVFPGQRRLSAHGELAPLRLSAPPPPLAGGTPVTPFEARSPFLGLMGSPPASTAAVGGGSASSDAPARPMVAAASAVSLADFAGSMRAQAAAHRVPQPVPRVLGIMSPPPTLLQGGGGAAPSFRLPSHSDHSLEGAVSLHAEGVPHGAVGDLVDGATPQRPPRRLASHEIGAFSPVEDNKEQHLLRRHSFGV